MSETPSAAADLDLLLERHLPAVRAFVRLRAGPAVAAREAHSDIVQSVCRELLEGEERFAYRGDRAFRGWLFTAALRKIMEKDRFYRAEKRDFGREVAAEDGERSLLDCYGHLATPSRDLATHEEVARIEAAYAKLSERDREVIALAKIAGLSHAEIGAQLGCSEESSRTALRRALVRLSAQLAPTGQP